MLAACIAIGAILDVHIAIATDSECELLEVATLLIYRNAFRFGGFGGHCWLLPAPKGRVGARPLSRRSETLQRLLPASRAGLLKLVYNLEIGYEFTRPYSEKDK